MFYNPYFIASATEEAQKTLTLLTKKYGLAPLEKADVIVVLGGDGFMLETLHQFQGYHIPFYGINFGSVGFLLNGYDKNHFHERLNSAEALKLYPLHMTAKTKEGELIKALAINEVSLLRQTRQSARLQIQVDGRVRLDPLVCDGALISTPAGSTAYNLSVHGPIIPLSSNLMALTPISAFRPRRWRGALLPHTSVVEFSVLDFEKRPVSAVADFTEVRNVTWVEIKEDTQTFWTLLFDAGHNLEERILNEQFIP
jgi:NAD+ kinase